jgi:heptosyltransferase-2
MMRVETLEQRIRSILVVRFSAIGDVILTLPVAEALKERFPEARIDYATKAEFADLVRHHPAVNRVWTLAKNSGFKGLRAMAREIEGQRYDLLTDLHANLRSAYLRLCGNAVIKRVYRKRTGARLLLRYLRVNLLKDAAPVADRYFTALEDFEIIRGERAPRLFLDDSSRQTAARVMRAHGLDGSERLLALAPGANYPTKRWPPERFAEAAAQLMGPGMKAVILGSGSDHEVTGRTAAALRERGMEAADLAGELSILESAAVIARSSLLVTNDSGLMHVAAALNVPLVAVFGPTSRELGFYPLGPRSRVLETALPCRPCSLHGDRKCRRGDLLCMEEVSPDQVAKTAREVME